MTTTYPEHNYVDMALEHFEVGQHLYGCLLHKGKRVHLLLAFGSATSSKVTATVLAVLPPNEALKDDKVFQKPIKLNVQACYVYGYLQNAPFARACYFRDSKSAPS